MPVVEALIVNTPERRRQVQMRGLEAVPGVIDTITGGEYSRMGTQLDRVELYLRISIIASLVAGVAGLASIFFSSRKR